VAVEVFVIWGSFWACYDPALTLCYVYIHLVEFDPQLNVYTYSSFPFFMYKSYVM